MRLATRLKKRLGRRIKDFYRKEKFVRGVKEDIIRIIKPIRSDIFSFSFSLSTRCNLKCDFCPKTNLGLIKEIDIKPEVLEKIYELSSSTVETVKILGIGEPLVYPNFLEVVENLKKHKAKVSFTTNAVLLNEKISRKLCEMSVDEIVFSIQGATRKTHEIIKGGSKFDRVIKNVKILSGIKGELNEELPKLCINFVGMMSNVSELPKLVELSSEIGVNHITLGNLMPLDREIAKEHLHVEPETAKQYINEAKMLCKEFGITFSNTPVIPTSKFCAYLWFDPYILPNGDVYPCNFLGTLAILKPPLIIWYDGVSIKTDPQKFKLSNILEEDLEKIWNNRKARVLRSSVLAGLREDRKIKWTRNEYKSLLQKNKGNLEPVEYCRICPNRFRITH